MQNATLLSLLFMKDVMEQMKEYVCMDPQREVSVEEQRLTAALKEKDACLVIDDEYAGRVQTAYVKTRNDAKGSVTLTFPGWDDSWNRNFSLNDPHLVTVMDSDRLDKIVQKARMTAEGKQKWKQAFLQQQQQQQKHNAQPEQKDEKRGDSVDIEKLVDFKTLSDTQQALFEANEFTDFELQCADGNRSAHRAILAVSSPVFAAMFKSKLQETATGVAEFPQFSVVHVDFYLRFVYTGQVNLPTTAKALIEVIRFAQYVQHNQLVKLLLPHFTKLNIKDEYFLIVKLVKELKQVEGLKPSLIPLENHLLQTLTQHRELMFDT